MEHGGEAEPALARRQWRKAGLSISAAQAALLGIVQGLTEFLPISSSAHLVILPAFLRWPQPTMTFDAILHGGTAAAALWYYRQAWWRMLIAAANFVQYRQVDSDLRWLAFLTVGTLPAVVAGVLFEAAVEPLFALPRRAAAVLMITGLVLVASEALSRRRSAERPVDSAVAAAVGVAQAMALIPGLSRAGMTIGAGQLLGLGRESAARFSFLLAAPITAGACLKQAVQAIALAGTPAEPLAVMAIGFCATLVAGIVAIDLLLRWARRSSFVVFAFYCWLLAGLSLWLLP